MDNILHIFFSKESLTTFKNSTLKGETLLFEEKLTEGIVTTDIFSDSFWSKRYEHFENTYQVSRIAYFDSRVKPILQLEEHEDYTDIVLWLDYTKESQVNLIALGAFLTECFSKKTTYHLVCSGKHKGRKELQKLTNYSAEEYAILFNYKVKITLPNLEYLKKCWQAYVIKNDEFLFNEFTNKFRYLEQLKKPQL
ncbi:MAG: hypothetical protein ACPGU6_04080 [Tenacibaculum sp.]